jgi:hypothetical protein
LFCDSAMTPARAVGVGSSEDLPHELHAET